MQNPEGTNEVTDLRVDLVLRVDGDHSMRQASSKDAPSGERWRCKCGADYKGDGAIKKGRRHNAAAIVEAFAAAGLLADPARETTQADTAAVAR